MRKPSSPRDSFQFSSFDYRAITGGEDSLRLTVETIDNHVYFYADVDSDRCLALMRSLRETDTRLRAQHLSRGLENTPPIPIWLHIHSYGGDLFAGFSAADQIRLLKSPVYSVVEGICASAAALISMSCSRRYILPNSFMLIHQLSGAVWGTHEQFKDELNLQSKAMERLIAFYASVSKVTEDEIRNMLQRDFWMDAEACVEFGFVDEILK